jgi:hypothetical protein
LAELKRAEEEAERIRLIKEEQDADKKKADGAIEAARVRLVKA